MCDVSSNPYGNVDVPFCCVITVVLFLCIFREHVFGLSGNLYSGKQVHVTSDMRTGKPLLVYSSAAVGVMHDPSTNKQAFLTGHTDDITCISMSADGKVLATGQIGKGAYVNVWSLKALSCARDTGGNDLYVSREQVTSSATGAAPSSASPAWVCCIGGTDGYSPGFFQRGVCAVELSPTGKYVLAIGCDDKHRLGIWDITRGGALVCDTITQNGLPPQIKGVFWCPTPQQTGEFVTKEHCGACDMFVTVGVHHLKFWSFASKATNFISNSVTGGGNALIARGGKIDKSLGAAQPAINLCAAYIVNSDGQADLVTGGSNGFVYLYRQGVCVAVSCMGKKPSAGNQATVTPAANRSAEDGAGSAASVTNPHAVFSLAVAHSVVFAGGRNGTIHCLDNRSLQKLITLNLFDGVPERPPSSASRNSARGTTVVQDSGMNILVTGIAVLMADSSNPGGASSKVSKRDKHLRLVATTNSGVAKYLSVNVGSSALALEKPPKDLFHYHMGSLWGLAVEHGRHARQEEGKLLVSCGDDKVVAVWDTKRWTQLCSAKTQAAAKCCYLDEMKQYVAVGLSSGGVLVYSIYVSEAAGGGDDNASVVSVASSRARPGSVSAGARMTTAQRARPSSAPAAMSASLVQRVYRKDATSEISDVKFDSRGSLLAVGSHDRCVYLYQMLAGNTYNLKLLSRLQGHNAYITHIDFSYDNRMLRTTCGAYELLFWSCETGKQVTATSMNESWRTNTVVLGFEAMGIWPPGSDGTDVNSVDVSKESGLLAAADDFGTLKLFNYPCIVKHAPGRTYGGHCSHVVNTRFYNDGHNNSTTHLATTGGNDAALISWSVKPIHG